MVLFPHIPIPPYVHLFSFLPHIFIQCHKPTQLKSRLTGAHSVRLVWKSYEARVTRNDIGNGALYDILFPFNNTKLELFIGLCEKVVLFL